MNYILGIDIGGTTVKIGLFGAAEGSRTAFSLIKKTAIVTRTEDSGNRILPDIAETVSALLVEFGIESRAVLGAGIGVPGPVLEIPGGSVVNHCVNLGWGRKDVAGEFRALTGIENVLVTNDANAATIGEVYYGMDYSSARRNAVMITIGTGIGGGIVVKGNLVNGTFGSAGELGHMKVMPAHDLIRRILRADPENEQVRAIDDLEHYVAAPGIARVAEAYLEALATESALRAYDVITAKEIFDEAKRGDRAASELAEFFFDTIGTALANTASVIDPALFIIGGGVSAAGEYLLNGIREVYRKRVFHASKDAEFRLARLGNEAGIYGAAGLIVLDVHL